MSNPIARHFKQPGGIPAAVVASGVLTAWCAAFTTMDHSNTDNVQVVAFMSLFTAVPAFGYLVWRVARPFPKGEVSPSSRCAVCDRAGPVVPVRYLQHTGVLVVMITRELPVYLCRPCGRSAFARMTLHTLALGWWGIFSVFITPGILLSNLMFLVRSEAGGTGAAKAHTNRLLEERRDYARNLKATKDEATVLDVLAKDTGLDRETIAPWLRTL